MILPGFPAAVPARAFPSLVAITQFSEGDFDEDHEILVPVSCAVGELIVILLNDGNYSTAFGGGYDPIAGSQIPRHLFLKAKANSQPLRISMNYANLSVSGLIIRIKGADQISATSGYGRVPPAHTIASGRKNALWGVSCFRADVTAPPSGYSNLMTGAGMATAFRPFEAATESPGAFQVGFDAWVHTFAAWKS